MKLKDLFAKPVGTLHVWDVGRDGLRPRSGDPLIGWAVNNQVITLGREPKKELDLHTLHDDPLHDPETAILHVNVLNRDPERLKQVRPLADLSKSKIFPDTPEGYAAAKAYALELVTR